MTNNDITIIEKIVSGELSDQERSRELRRFETEKPECWSALAKAFVEKQVLREMFAEMEVAAEPAETDIKQAPKSTRPWLIGMASAAILTIGMMLGTLFDRDSGADVLTTEDKITQPEESDIAVSTPEPATAYIATHLENGEQVVVPVSYYPRAQ